MPHTIAQNRLTYRGRKFSPHQILSEIRRRRYADQCAHRHAPACGQQQRNPAAHGRPDQDLRAFRQRRNHTCRILGPTPDRAILKTPFGCAVAGIIKAQKRLPARGTPGREEFRLTPRHVAIEATQKHHARAAPSHAPPGQMHAIAAIKPPGFFLHGRGNPRAAREANNAPMP